MNGQQAASSTIKINVPGGMLNHARNESRRIGISLQDFIRMLMATYFASAPAIRSVTRDQALWDRAREEIGSGQYTAVRTKQELHAYLDSLNA